MNRSPLYFLAAAAVFGFAGCKNFPGKKDESADPVAETDKARDQRTAAETAFYEECRKLGESGGTIAGRDGWLFDANELLQVSRINSTSAAAGAIADYAQQLRGQNIDLILVPVPPKALVYPDKLARGAKVSLKPRKAARLDSVLKAAMDDLSARHVKVVDLLPVLMAHRDDKAGTAYTRTGLGWSPYGVQVAVKEIAGAVRDSRAGGRGGVTGISSEAVTLNFTGSLAADVSKSKPEVLPASKIGRISEGKVRSLSFNTSGGSLLLMGSSDIFAWREANNPQGSSGAFCSLADQLAAELQTIPDVIPSSGEGRNSPRLRILRERTNGRSMLGSTRTVIWVVPALDLCAANWQRVPLQLQYSESSPEIQLR